MAYKEILKTVYSPFQAFRGIIDNPQYKGPILIMALFIAANIGSVYMVLPKMYVEHTLPPVSQRDAWTENCTLWTSNAPHILESGDCIPGKCYGNNSIQFSMGGYLPALDETGHPEAGELFRE